MISMMRQRLNKEEGFTLVELMVVVLIIAILIAIAIPTFLGARERAQDRATQSNLRNALTSAKVHYTDEEDFSNGAAPAADVTAVLLEAIEPSLDFDIVAIDPAVNPDQIAFVVESVNAGDRQIITFTGYSASGSHFCVSDQLVNGAAADTSGTTYGSTTLGGAQLLAHAACQDAEW